MAENIAFPSVLAPASLVERLKSNTRLHMSAVSGIPKTVENPGSRWEFEFGYDQIDGNNLKAQMVSSAVGKIRGQAKRLHLHNMARPEISGSLSVSNLVGNGDMLLGSSGWAQTPGSGGHISFANGKCRLGSGTGNASINRSVTMTGSTYYSVHIAISAGSSDVVNVTVGGSNSNFTGSGRHTIVFSSSGTTNIVITNTTINSFLHVDDIIVARAAISNGVDQTGSVIDITGLGGSSDEAIKANDWVGINGELKRVVEAIPSISGSGSLVIEPPMHQLVPNGSAIVLNRPFSKFILREDKSDIVIDTPFLINLNLHLVEDIS